jgi:5-methylcytosine-specific restriction endonuclease McrA
MEYKSRQHYKVLRKCSVDEVLPFTGPSASVKLYAGHMVKMTSLRYQTFSKSTRCVCCGIEGTVFLLELPDNDGNICRPHFNLYAEREGRLVQMTKDHIQPKSKDGRDHINNMQTMCHICNELKGSRHIKGGNRKNLSRLREIQDGAQVVYTVERQSTHIMEGFATTPRGIAEIARDYFMGMYDLDDSDDLDINVDMERKQVIVDPNDGGPEIIFRIKPLRRI